MQRQAEELEAAAEARVKDLNRQKANLLQSIKNEDEPALRAIFLDEIKATAKLIEAAEGELRAARRRTASTKETEKDVIAIVDGAKNIKATWDQKGEEGIRARREIVDTWVWKILVEVIPVEGKPRSSTKRLYVFLRTAPNTPYIKDIEPNFENRWHRFGQPVDGNNSSELLRSTGSAPSLTPAVFVLTWGGPNRKAGEVDIRRAA
jgi:hypothetical protein